MRHALKEGLLPNGHTRLHGCYPTVSFILGVPKIQAQAALLRDDQLALGRPLIDDTLPRMKANLVEVSAKPSPLVGAHMRRYVHPFERHTRRQGLRDRALSQEAILRPFQ